jgi:hypothetical protein
MTEHHDLRVLGRLAAAEQHQPAEDPDHDQVEQAKGHKPRSCRNRLIQPICRSQHLRRVLKRYTAWTTTRSASSAPGTGTSPCPCSRTRSWPSPPALPGHSRRNPLPPAGTPAASRVKRGPAACGQTFSPPRTYSPPPVITGGNDKEMIPLTAGVARRLFCLYTRVTRPEPFHEHWSNWRRRRQARARRSHYARRAERLRTLL